jgi:predicted site-specific integrase-resolvase
VRPIAQCARKSVALRHVYTSRKSQTGTRREGKGSRQVERLQQKASERGYQVVPLIQEQASGLNEKRKDLKKLFHLNDHQEIELVLIVSCALAMAISKRPFVGGWYEVKW